jgi:hypothetical protein
MMNVVGRASMGVIQNIQRHDAYLTRTPPMIGPSALARAITLPKTTGTHVSLQGSSMGTSVYTLPLPPRLQSCDVGNNHRGQQSHSSSANASNRSKAEERCLIPAEATANVSHGQNIEEYDQTELVAAYITQLTVDEHERNHGDEEG